MTKKKQTKIVGGIVLIILFFSLINFIFVTLPNMINPGSERPSTNQDDWLECRSEVWETCGMTEHVDALNYIQDLSWNIKVNNTEIDFLYGFVFETSTNCWEEFAEKVCDDNFDMDKIMTAKISLE